LCGGEPAQSAAGAVAVAIPPANGLSGVETAPAVLYVRPAVNINVKLAGVGRSWMTVIVELGGPKHGLASAASAPAFT
jgi:hypothetical protein